METNAAFLAAIYAKLVNECAMARKFGEAKLNAPLRDCLHRIRGLLTHINNLLRSTFANSTVAGFATLNNLALDAVRRAEATQSPEAFDKVLAMLLEMKKLFASLDNGGNAKEGAASSEDSAARRKGAAQERLPRVSVVIPAYNSSATLWRAIESALAQEFGGPLEVIVVDDCSTDETGEVLKLYDGRIRTVRMPSNRGVAAARNAGLAVARGECVAFLDADDEFLPGRLARTVEALETARANDIVMAYSDATLVDETGWTTAPSLAPRVCSTASMRAPSIDDLFSGCWWPILPSAVTVRKDVLEKCGGFEEAFAGAGGHLELYAWLRVRELGQFAFIATPLVQWRLLPTLERLEKYLPNLAVLYRLMHERYGAKGARMVRDFAITNAGALAAEGYKALARKDVISGTRALMCALAHLSNPDLSENELTILPNALSPSAECSGRPL